MDRWWNVDLRLRPEPMNFRGWILASVRFHARAHLGVVLGAAVGSAALIGALLVGHSVRRSLEDQAGQRLGATGLALDSGDRLFGAELESAFRAGTMALPGAGGGRGDWGINPFRPPSVSLLHVRGTGARADGTARALEVHVYGVTSNFWALSARAREVMAGVEWEQPSRERRERLVREAEGWQRPAPGKVCLNAALASQLRVGAGDTVIVRFAKPSALSADSVLSARNEANGVMRLEVEAVVSGDAGGDFSLTVSQRPPLNAFVRLDELSRMAGVDEKRNLLLVREAAAVRPEGDWRMRMRRALGGAGAGWIPGPLRRPLLSLAERLSETPATAELLMGLAGQTLARAWRLADGQIEIRELPGGEVDGGTGGAGQPPMVEVATPRVFLDRAVVAAATAPDPRLPEADRAERAWLTEGIPLVTYLANQIRHGERTVPYSMVCGIGAPWTPRGMAEDEMVVNAWLAEELGVKPGDRLSVTYYDPEAGAQLVERTNEFRVRAVVPVSGLHADRSLMPGFPGLAKAESTSDWDAGFPLVHKIRDQDEAYWKEHRGTPKAFVTWEAGRRLWGNRFGEATAVRFVVPPRETPRGFAQLLSANIRATLSPADVGLAFQPVQSMALTAARSGQDFAGLFVGFSFFLVVSALLLMSLMFQFGLEQRLAEVGTLRAIGFAPLAVRRLWLVEGLVVACAGSVVGAIGGAFQARSLIHALTHRWRDAVGGAVLEYHGAPGVILGGMVLSVAVCMGAIFFTLRRQFHRPIRELLSGEIARPRTGGRSRGNLVGLLAGGSGLGLTAWAVMRGEAAGAELFFGAGGLLLVGGLGWVSGWLGRWGGAASGAVRWTEAGLAVRGTTRRRSRSLATVALLASGTFLIAALGAFRLDARKGAWERGSGTGGFALIGETSLPVSQDLNRASGLEFFGLGTNELERVSFVPFRVRDGDDASCLNLSRAQRPRLLGVEPGLLAGRGAFSFAGRLESAAVGSNAWEALRWEGSPGTGAAGSVEAGIPEIPAIGDAASIQWALGKKLGDVVEMTDEGGRPFRLRLVAGVANSVLQGNLVIDERAFRRLYPGVGGYRWFLIDAPSNSVAEVSSRLARALEDRGMALTPASRRLAEYHAVQNTYLATFQVLGGFGLLLGSAGLGVVVLRNVLERRAELALLAALGFTRGRLKRLVLLEHGALLVLGLAIGIGAAAVAVLPALVAPTVELPWFTLSMTLGGVVAIGALATWLATWFSLRGRLTAALRGE